MIKKYIGDSVFRVIAYFCLPVFLILPLQLSGADTEKNDSTKNSRYKFGIIPSLVYDSDLGLKYGAVINLFDFGNTKLPPNYEQYLMLRLTNTTKGTLNLQALLESESLINKTKVIAEASYIVDKRLDFSGFNGTKTTYNSAFEKPESSEYLNSVFYAHQRNFLRLRFDVQTYLSGSKLRLLTGFTLNHYFVSPAQPKESDFNESTLYEKYINWEVINPQEKSGGNISLLSLGLVYDSRNDPSYSTNGKWFETILLYSPTFLGDSGFTKFIATYRQHFSILNDNLTFSFRVSAQQKLGGDIPFYFVPTYYDSRLSYDGVGGAYNFRGAKRNRIAADGFMIGNFEVKGRFFNLELLKQEFYVSLSAFYDNAYVTQEYKVNLENVPADQHQIHFNQGKQKIHHTFGPGFYLVWNKNNVVTAHYGFSTNKQLGSGGLYVGSSLLF